jgi:SepF-like predicted cell division protein (DUF552 family)
MKNILTEEVINDIVKALEQGKSYEYSNNPIYINITPNEIHIKYKDITPRQKFVDYVESLDDELFVEVCESFQEGELKDLNENLENDDSVQVFKNRVKEIASRKMIEELSDLEKYKSELESVIEESKKELVEVHDQINSICKKYAV